MGEQGPQLLAVNAGSSSVKLALFALGAVPRKIVEGSIEKIGQGQAELKLKDVLEPADAPDHSRAAQILIDRFKRQVPEFAPGVIGHRIVHGGPKYYQTCLIGGGLITYLKGLTYFDPEHLPVELGLIQSLQQLFPTAKQIACFDTAFHHNLPMVAQRLPIPRRYEADGVRRYGFHGLSYAYVLKELRRMAGDEAANGKLILAHLGNGVSLAAVQGGKSIDTTMSMTPAGGVPMSSRSGDLDPGLVLYMARSENMDIGQFNEMVNFRSGLLGLSESTSDMKQLLENMDYDPKAKEAVELFCYQLKKAIGGLAAALGGLDSLVFSGGMGEAAPKVRARVCAGLEFLGVSLDEKCNIDNEALISADASHVAVRIIATDESMTIAEEAARLLGLGE